MVVAQLLSSGASWMDLKHFRLDSAHLPVKTVAVKEEGGRWKTVGEEIEPSRLEAFLKRQDVDLIHAYGHSATSIAAAGAFPFVTTTPPKGSPGLWKKRNAGVALDVTNAPEAVDERFRVERVEPPPTVPRIIGSTVRRHEVRSFIEQTYARLARFRSDLEWRVFEEAPLSDDLATLHLWVDAALDENDVDGYLGESLTTAMPSVASRTELNRWRSDEGRTAVLVRPRDANELAHAVLTSLFKPETIEGKIEEARLSSDRFDAAARATALLKTYQRAIG